jgi:PEP-CTERM motif
MRILWALVMLASWSQTFSSAAEVRTYRIVDTGEPTFRYGGGLLDFDLRATLRGTFEVTIAEDDTAKFSRFDVTLHDLVNTGSYDLGWAEGDSLADRLLQPLDDLWGVSLVEDGSDLLLFSQTAAAFGDVHLITAGRIDHLNAATVVFNLGSSYIHINIGDGMGVPVRPVLDVPSMSIGRGGSELLVMLVPEPSSLLLAAAGLMAVGLLRSGRVTQLDDLQSSHLAPRDGFEITFRGAR